MEKKMIKLTESDLHKIIESSVKKCIMEMGRFDSDLDADEIYGDRADREYKQSMRDKLFQDEWEMRNRRLRQKYPGKSEEWYEAMIDTFYENKKSRKAINEIGDTPKGNFALNAVRGRAVARPRYHNDKYGSLNDRAKQARIAGDASDKAWDNYTKNHNLGFHNEAGYNYGYSKGMEEGCNEESFQNNQNYTHFAVSKKSGKILNGWDYSEYDPSELRQFKKDYFDVDMQDYGFDPKSYKIVTGKYLLRQGVDPNDNSNWANNDEANDDWIG